MNYDTEYLKLLAQQYPDIKSSCSEIIRLRSKLKLPKLTEHFMSDIHGEYESFLHILKNGSGVIKEKITSIYGRTLSEEDRQLLATLIYYPEQKLDLIKKDITNIDDWYKITLNRLIEICRVTASKYTRSTIRKHLPESFGDIIDELIHSDTDYSDDKAGYYNECISSIVELDQAEAFIVDISELIKTLAIGELHIIGDIFDRGPRADIILDKLIDFYSVDIQWGNHDVQWMGAAAGSKVCVATVLALSTLYCNFDCLEDGYGINMRPLTVYAMETYADDPCECFIPRNPNMVKLSKHDADIWAKMHKAISIIRFKLEGQVIKRHPEFLMNNHLMLDKINYEDGTIQIEGKTYTLRDNNFPTIDPADPYRLTESEAEMMEQLTSSFLHSEKLSRHMEFLYSHGSMYLCENNNLLYHGCVPLNSDGTFRTVTIKDKEVSGKAFFDLAEQIAREGYFGEKNSPEKLYGEDFLWFLWCGCFSPVYGKNKMTAFERYFINDKSTWEEIKDPYYSFVENEETCNAILREFGIDPDNFSHIINGHVPVKIKKGESPIKADGKLFVIDGGLSKAYQSTTGIAGYTLIYNSHGLILSEHDSFESIESAVREEKDIKSVRDVFEAAPKRMLVADTDDGKNVENRIDALCHLASAYMKGIIKQGGK